MGHPLAAFPGPQQRTRLELKQKGLEPAPVEDTNTTSGGLAYYATALILAMVNLTTGTTESSSFWKMGRVENKYKGATYFQNSLVTNLVET